MSYQPLEPFDLYAFVPIGVISGFISFFDGLPNHLLTSLSSPFTLGSSRRTRSVPFRLQSLAGFW